MQVETRCVAELPETTTKAELGSLENNYDTQKKIDGGAARMEDRVEEHMKVAEMISACAANRVSCKQEPTSSWIDTPTRWGAPVSAAISLTKEQPLIR